LTSTNVLQPPAHIDFVGIGNMGSRMARRLLGAGYHLQVADKNENAVRSFVTTHGGAAATSLPALAAWSDAIITMLPDGKIVREVVLEDGGLLSGLRGGGIVIDMSSSNQVVFDRPSGGAGHCQMGALTLYHAAVFDWLLEKFPGTSRS